MQALAAASKNAAAKTLPGRPDVSVCAQDLVLHIPVVIWFMRRHMGMKRAKGLSLPQFRVLVRAERKGTLSDIASCLGTSLPTASRIVSGLVAKGYLAREESAEDRRCRHFSVTPRGQRVLKDAYDATQKAIEAELQPLTDVQCRDIAAAVRTLGQVFADANAE